MNINIYYHRERAIHYYYESLVYHDLSFIESKQAAIESGKHLLKIQAAVPDIIKWIGDNMPMNDWHAMHRYSTYIRMASREMEDGEEWKHSNG